MINRVVGAIRIVIVCVILVYTIQNVFKKNTSKNTPKNTLNNAPRTGILAAPRRTLRNMYSSSTAISTHNTVMNALSKQFASSVAKNKPRWDNLICIGDSYARGKFPFLQPNENMALMCYRVAATCPSSTVAATARSRVTDTENNPVETGDRRGSEMSTQYGNFVCKAAVRFMSEKRTPRDHISLKIRTRPQMIPQIAVQRPAVMGASAHAVITDILPQTEAAVAHVPTRRPRRTRNRRRDIAGGSQNTHDHGVVAATKSNIKQLKAEHETKKFREHSKVVDDTMALCRGVVDDPQSSGVSEDTFNDVYEVTTSLTADEFSDTGLTQIQILDLALKKIKSLDETTSKGVRETLCKRMATGIEDGKTVCATGKVARIMSVFEGVLENTQKAVSIAYVEKEIANMAAKVRDDFLDRVGPVGRKAYESTQSVPEYGTAMAKILREGVTEEYVNKLHMSPTIIDPLVELYSGSF